MFIPAVHHIGHCVEILSDELAQHPCTRAMQDAHPAHAHKRGIIDESGHHIDSLLATHTAHIQVLPEVELSAVHGFAGHPAIGGHIGDALLLLSGGIGKLQHLQFHSGAHIAAHQYGIVALYLFHTPHGVHSLDAGIRTAYHLALGGGRLGFTALGRRSQCLLGSLLFPLLLALAAFQNLAHLLFYQFILGLGVYLQHLLLELLEFFPHPARLFLFRLRLTYLAYHILDAFVAFLQQLLGLLLGFLQNGFPALLQFLYILFIAGSLLFQCLLVLAYVLALALPVAFVSHDILQILVALNIVGAHYRGGLCYHLFGQSCLAGYLYGKGRARPANGQLEQGSHLVPVVEHGSVDDALVLVGIMLQVLVMGGDYAEGLLLAELSQHALRNGRTYHRLGASAKLVNEQQGAVAGLSHHVLHV